MANIIHWLLPKEKKYYGILAIQSEKCLKASIELSELIDSYPKLSWEERKLRILSIKKIENESDSLYIELMNQLDLSDGLCADIKELAQILENLVDCISRAASDLSVFSIERIDEKAASLVNILCKSMDELNKNVKELRKLKHMKEHFNKILTLEKQADGLFEESLSELFHYFKNSIDIIKYKELYELIERSINYTKQAAVMIESIVTRHS